MTFQINYFKESHGYHGNRQGRPNTVPTVARGDHKKEEMLELSLGERIKLRGEKQKRKRTFWEEIATYVKAQMWGTVWHTLPEQSRGVGHWQEMGPEN